MRWVRHVVALKKPVASIYDRRLGAVILSRAKDPCSSLTVNFAKNLCICRPAALEETAEMLRPAQHVVYARMECVAGLRAKTYFVYIMASKSRTLYTGITNNLERRVFQHKTKQLPGFAHEYNITRLVYFEKFGDVRAAIQREKQIKGWLRAKKVALIIKNNPAWRDLSQGWYGKR